MCCFQAVEVLVSKTNSEWEHPFHNIRCPCWLVERSFIWETRLGKGNFWIKVLSLVQLITENGLRHARGPVHSTSSPLNLFPTRVTVY